MKFNKILIGFFLLTASLFAKDVSAYITYQPKSVDDVKKSLSANGFEVIGEYKPIDDTNNLIVVTHPELKKIASKKDRGFAGVLKLLVKEKGIKAQNPEYFVKAFLQKENDAKVGENLSALLTKALGEGKETKEVLKEEDIEHYKFMFGMPYYEDMVEVASGDNAKLVSKIKEKAGKDLVFELKLENDAYLIGVKQTDSRGENYYLEKIDPKGQNIAFLPYMVLIEGGKAKIMHAKFYLALSYPRLEMTNFMKIASTPGEIEDFFKGLFK